MARELFLYTVFSALALAVDTAAFMFSLGLGAPWQLAATLGFGLGLVVVYGGSTRFVFRERRVTRQPTEFVIFGLIGGAGLLLTQLSLAVLLGTLHWHPLVAKLVTAAGVFCFNFILRKSLLFSQART